MRLRKPGNINLSTSGAKGWLSVAAVAVLLWSGAWYVFKDSPRPLPDFSRYQQAAALKKAFYAYLEPIVRRQNAAVREQRARLDAIAKEFEANGAIGFWDRRRLDALAERYAVPEDLSVKMKIGTLKQRVDIIPVELALVQAAKESAWGRSRFAVKANNLFGHWCFDPGCGLVPDNRGAGKTHELKAYDSVGDAIANYMLNLNTHPKYLKFRQLREQLRKSEADWSGLPLADGLLYYSERRQAYIREVKSMIRQYRRFADEDGNTQA